MSEVTRILSAIEQGDPHAAERLLPLVCDELRKLAAAKLAQEKPRQTLLGRLPFVSSPSPWTDAKGHPSQPSTGPRELISRPPV